MEIWLLRGSTAETTAVVPIITVLAACTVLAKRREWWAAEAECPHQPDDASHFRWQGDVSTCNPSIDTIEERQSSTMLNLGTCSSMPRNVFRALS